MASASAATDSFVAASKDIEIRMQLGGSAKELAPELAATNYQVLAPVERKRGFAFTAPDFVAQLALASAPPRMTVTWALDAEAHDGWIALNTCGGLACARRATASAAAGEFFQRRPGTV